MDNGARAFVLMMVVSLLLGAVVVLAVPTYRNTMRALAAGMAEKSPIWKSNSEYYEAVTLDHEETGGETDAE